MSPLEIIKLVGFATGAALHLHMCWLLLMRQGIREAERLFLWLGLSIGAWHLGNFLATIHDLLGIPGLAGWLKAANVVGYVGLAFLPPLLIHAHLRLWDWLDERAPRGIFRPWIWAGYVPLVLLPWVVKELWREPYEPPIDRLAPLLLPFMLWFVVVCWECALIDLRLARRVEAARERRFFGRLGATLAVIGGLFLLTYVVGARGWPGVGPYFDTAARLSSLVPTATIAYYIYRYRYLGLVIRQSFIYAAFAAAVMLIYFYVIRRLGLVLEERYQLRAGAVEALLTLGLMFLAEPMRELAERYVKRLFVREVGLYRELVAQVGEAGANSGNLAHFIGFVTRRLEEALGLSRVEIFAAASPPERWGEAAEVCRLAEERRLTQVEDEALLVRLGARACDVLWREGRVVGLLVAGGEPGELTAEKREVLAVLAGHIAVALENTQLLEEKVKLERELAAHERLAALGQMAATVAHEVKNPLSAIKSIAQVMREDDAVSREYGRDLDLITGEVDRLSRSVSQLLSFSRPAAVAASSSTLGEVVANVLALLRPDLEAEALEVTLNLGADPRLDGEVAGAVKEVLLNLALNAAQASGRGGRVQIESRADAEGRLRLAVGDDGLGVPPGMREKIFEPFFTTKQRGTGLGLAIVARRVREMGGTISVESPAEDGRGARFELVLPLGVTVAA